MDLKRVKVQFASVLVDGVEMLIGLWIALQ